MNFNTIKLLVAAFIMFAASSAFAVPYNINVDTSSLNGANGFIYLQYGGINAVDSTATVYNYSGGSLAAASSANVVDGSAVSGQLPSSVVFANTNGVNDYNHAILFGSSLDFNLLLSSNTFGAPVGGGSTFSLGLFADESGLIPLVTATGTVFTADLANDGNISFNYSDNVTVAPVPEPGTIVLLGVGMFGLCIFGKRRLNTMAG
ncbi:MAG: NF038129 family PEP-CTERM protein [Pedobacter sp.]